MKYIVRLNQSYSFDMEVEAENETEAMQRALIHATDGERLPKSNDERIWEDFIALYARRI